MLLAAILLSAALGCDGAAVGVGCSYEGSLENNGVTLEGSNTTPGHGDDDLNIDIDAPESTDPNTSCTYLDPTTIHCTHREGIIEHNPEGTVTLSDIAHFIPTIGTHAMQPDGWAIVGLPANFMSTATTHTVTGTLLGNPAEVRFTPVRWHWDYGDNTTTTTATGGATWERLGRDEFDPTPTSHTYRAKATYTVTLRVTFHAEYRIAGASWHPIPGTLTLPAPPLAILTTGVRTILVNDDCLTNPHGPGC